MVRKRGLPAVNPLEKKVGFFGEAFFIKFLLPLLILSFVRIMKRRRGVRGCVLAFTASNDKKRDANVLLLVLFMVKGQTNSRVLPSTVSAAIP